MFDEDDYISDEEQNVYQSHKAIPSSKVLTPASNSDFNHLTGDGQNILKMMKERGIDLTDNQIKKLKVHHHSQQKNTKQLKGRSGFFDAGTNATAEQLIKALNKALSKADPQQASAILTHILEKKSLSIEDLNKFGVMKCKILFGLGAYKDCEQKAQNLIQKASTKLNTAIFSNYLAKCKVQNGKIFEGHLDFLRSKALIAQVKAQELQKQHNVQQKQEPSSKKQLSQEKNETFDGRKMLQINFKESQIDSVLREIDYTEMQYNIKMAEIKNTIQVVHPYFPQFRHRKIKQIACGDYHALFLVQGSFENVETSLKSQWKTQVFAMGENGVGQALGNATTQFFKQPVLIPQLSGKGITGIYAYKQTSIAYNDKGDIYEWGVKENRDNKISFTFTVGEQIQSVQKGHKHYALMTKSKKFYTWGQMESRGVVIYKQPQPHMQQSTNIVNYTCGNSCIVCVDSYGDAFALGNNEFNQLHMKGEYFTKTFKKIPDQILGKIKKAFCIGDCTFFENQDEQIYFTGKYTHNSNELINVLEQVNDQLRQAEFPGEIRNVISICGHIGCYYLTNEKGQIYKWQVDQNVKFRLHKDNPEVSQRYCVQHRGQLFRAKSLIEPEFCSVKKITQTAESYQEIKFQLELKDRFGLYGNKDFMVAPKCQIHLSTYDMTKTEVLKENKQFLEKYKLSTAQNRILLNQIIDPKLYSYKITKNQQEPWIYDLEIVVDTAGKYWFYVVLEQTLLHSDHILIEKSIKESQQTQKNLAEKKAKEQDRRRRAQEEKKRLLEQKNKKQQDDQDKRKQTQKRAEQALKKYMKEQEQMKFKQAEQRRARRQMQTGGGFDLTKLMKRNSSELKNNESKTQIKSEIPERTNESFMKSSESFLPDINARPGSKRKLNIRRDSAESVKKINPLQKTAGFTNDSKGFLQSKTKDIGKNLMMETTKVKQMKEMVDLNKTSGGGKTLVKRGLSKAKK